jgi:transcription antitermination factor NusA-like protein
LKAPVCNFCLTNSILCINDQNKLDEGKISQLDIEVSRTLYKLQKKHKAIDALNVIKAEEVDSTLLVFVNPLRPLNFNEIKAINDDLKQIFGREVRIIEQNASKSRVIQELLLPIKIVAHSSVWLPDGSQIFKITVKSSEIKGLEKLIESMKNLAKSVLKTEIFIDIT